MNTSDGKRTAQTLLFFRGRCGRAGCWEDRVNAELRTGNGRRIPEDARRGDRALRILRGGLSRGVVRLRLEQDEDRVNAELRTWGRHFKTHSHLALPVWRLKNSRGRNVKYLADTPITSTSTKSSAYMLSEQPGKGRHGEVL